MRFTEELFKFLIYIVKHLTMKRSKKYSLLLVAMVLITGAASVNLRGIESLEVSAIENTRMIRLETNAPSVNSFELLLMDRWNRTIYSENISSEAEFEKIIDLSGYKNGTYRIIAQSGNLRLNKVIRVTGDRIETRDSYYSFVPQFRTENGKILVHYINHGVNSIDMVIESASGIHLDQGIVSIPASVNYAIPTGQLASGHYTLYFYAGRELFTHRFRIN